jgi:hypothetical protein
MVSVGGKERGNTQRLTQLTVGLAALGLALAPPHAALADLGPPSSAPAIAKRKCARYTVVTGPAGPTARCTRHKTQTLRPISSRSSAKAAVGDNLPPSPRPGATRQLIGGPNGSQATRLSPGAVPDSVPTKRPSQDGAAPSRSSTGMSLGAVLAIIAVSTLTGMALVALVRKPLLRRRDEHPRGTAS